jgi:formyltetrahydrofolate synthetase
MVAACYYNYEQGHECFHTDTKAEIAMIRKYAEEACAACAVSEHWAKGGEGAFEPAEAVKQACESKPKFKLLYPMEMEPRERSEKIVKTVYGVSGVAVGSAVWGNDAVVFIRQAMNTGMFAKIKVGFPVGGALDVLVPMGKAMPQGFYLCRHSLHNSRGPCNGADSCLFPDRNLATEFC